MTMERKGEKSAKETMRMMEPLVEVEAEVLENSLM